LLNTGKFKNSLSLRITLIAGLILFAATGVTLSIIYLSERNASKTIRARDNFTRSLQQYDLLAMELPVNMDFERLHRELDKIEKMTIGVESWLSVLKRRRILAGLHSPSMENYRKSVDNALLAYPMSEPIAAIAVEATIKNTAINREAEEKLREWLALLNDPSFNTVRLGLHILLGDFRNPERASVLPSDLFSDGTQAITSDLAILKILRQDIRGAMSDIQMMLYSPTIEILRLAAEFHYDFGDLLRSAEIFSLINDEKAISRQADALYLAGFKDSARAIWSTLADLPNEQSLYNLGVTSENADEAVSYFRTLVNINSSVYTSSRQFGFIRYSRFFNSEYAVSLLQGIEGLNQAIYPYIDLEVCKRQAERQELGRQFAEAWLLLERHDANEDLYKWVSWLFLYQRNYSELNFLLNRVEALQPEDQWVKICRAIQLMFEGDLDNAEKILRLIPQQEADWTVHANLGRIIEIQRSPSRALEQYELAMSKIQNPKTASEIQVRIARCFSALGRGGDAFRTLQYAVELDPGNLTARLELDRMLY
jgi:tetratricopeptide (TPR) repeat protein